MTELQHQFAQDGVAFIPQALDARVMKMAENAFNWTKTHPGPGAGMVLAGTPGEFYQDHANPDAFKIYRELLVETALSKIVSTTMRSHHLWFLYEQIWLKEGGETRRTPWHQDAAYVPMAGDHLSTVWLNLDPVPKQQSLEFVPGSHRGPLFNPTAFDPKDATATMFPKGTWPPLPDIDADRSRFNIVSWPIEPGDLLIFHPALLHGGAPTSGTNRRRTISLRFFGDDACCAERPKWAFQGPKDGDKPRDPMEEMSLQPVGTSFRHPSFPQLL